MDPKMASATENRDRQAAALAADIMTLARNELLVHFRFLDRAIANIRFVPSPDAAFATDGRNIFYSPWYILNLYMTEDTLVARNLLHTILHCVFRHYFVGKDIDRAAWDLAADAAVEHALNELREPQITARKHEAQEPLLRRLGQELPVLSAERIYHFLTKEGFSDAVMDKERLPFIGDAHGGWYREGPGSGMADTGADLEKLWEDISKRMQTELEVVMGSDDALTQSLKDINRVRYHYTEFLRRFGVRGEIMKLSEEEFDNIYYTYGMDLYGNIPLVEPLEYRDEKKIRDFVIAIDTSGSVKGEVVQKFVQHTHDILSSQTSFDTDLNLYIIQCDDRIEEAVHITDKEAFDRYLAQMEIRGLGETDFRPVFAYIDGLRKEKKLKDLKGLLYFTDGKGTFPEKCPDYDVAFVIQDDGLRNVWTPEWAMKLYLTEEEILDDRFGQ